MGLADFGEMGNAGGQDAAMSDEAHFRVATEAAQVGIYVLQDRLFKYVNPFLAVLLGYTPDELLGRRGPLDVVSPEQHPQLLQQLDDDASSVRGESCELSIIRKDGAVFSARILGAPTSFEGRPATVGTVFDISAQKRAEMKIRELADFDPLTGLPNYRVLCYLVGQMLRSNATKRRLRWW